MHQDFYSDRDRRYFFSPSQLYVYIDSGVQLTSSVVAGESVPGVKRLRRKVEHVSDVKNA
jgi:hypothetical protein